MRFARAPDSTARRCSAGGGPKARAASGGTSPHASGASRMPSGSRHASRARRASFVSRTGHRRRGSRRGRGFGAVEDPGELIPDSALLGADESPAPGRRGPRPDRPVTRDARAEHAPRSGGEPRAPRSRARVGRPLPREGAGDSSRGARCHRLCADECQKARGALEWHRSLFVGEVVRRLRGLHPGVLGAADGRSKDVARGDRLATTRPPPDHRATALLTRRAERAMLRR